MNRATKAALIDAQSNVFQLKSALFHSTPILERRRQNYWNPKFNPYAKRSRKLNAKQSLLRNVGAFAEHLFESWQVDGNEYDPSSSQGRSWFRRDYRSDSFKGGRSSNNGQRSKRGFEFCEDDFEVETLFRSSFGGSGFYYWSFVDEPPRQRRTSSYSNNYRTSWKWRHHYEDEYEYDSSSSASENSESDFTSHRLALGLSASGPLKMDDIKNAYRKCALKWHPDRHEGSSKVAAEEKFKVCSAAYQSLCDELAHN